MALVLDGGGTITGLTVGGLPDATIQQADLAPNVAGNGPAFSAYQSVAQSLTLNVWTKLQFQTKEFDTNGNFDNTTNYRFTPTVAGYYQVSGCFFISQSSTANYIGIYKNGSSFKRGLDLYANSAGSQVSALIYMNGTTDYIEIYGMTGFSQTTSAAAYVTYFQAVMVRAA